MSVFEAVRKHSSTSFFIIQCYDKHTVLTRPADIPIYYVAGVERVLGLPVVLVGGQAKLPDWTRDPCSNEVPEVTQSKQNLQKKIMQVQHWSSMEKEQKEYSLSSASWPAGTLSRSLGHLLEAWVRKCRCLTTIFVVIWQPYLCRLSAIVHSVWYVKGVACTNWFNSIELSQREFFAYQTHR